jgi:hypothetical protein
MNEPIFYDENGIGLYIENAIFIGSVLNWITLPIYENNEANGKAGANRVMNPNYITSSWKSSNVS